ncbi:MAG: penicillin-binding protein 2 [Patescibacteria group bacterium]
MAVRFLLLNLFFAFLLGALGIKLYDLQVQKGDFYFEKAEARSQFQAQLELRRGQITLNNRSSKVALALNKDYPVIFASPKQIEDAKETASAISPIVGIAVADLEKSFQNPQSLFKLLVDRADGKQIKELEGLNIKGVYVDQKQYRFYQFQRLASQFMGFVGINEKYDEPIGLYGVEKFYNEELSKGKTINTTLDINLQSQAELSLTKLMRQFNSIGGTIIIQEPRTGKILALANAPDFDPNVYGKYPIKNFINPAVQSMYEPGSVFKPFTMAAGIDAGIFTPDTKYFDKGSVTLNGKKITNWDHKSYGWATMTNVLERSINTGSVWAQQQLGNKKFYEYLKKLGFGDLTNIDLPDEAKGTIKNLERKDQRAIDFANAAFGQGTGVTPIQLITAFSSLANGGLLMRPYINENLEPQVIRQVFKSETASSVIGMLESAVEKGGVAGIPQYHIAGKTGTAQIPDFKNGGYADEYIHTYVGFAPASNAKFIILIKLDKPASELAALTVVPAFKELAQYVLNYYNIPPDKPIN